MTNDLTSPNSVDIQMMSWADSRAMLLATLSDLRSGKVSIANAGATVAVLKELRENINSEIAFSKHCIATEGTAHAFAKAVGMGKARLLG
jgi:hypothetical protein